MAGEYMGMEFRRTGPVAGKNARPEAEAFAAAEQGLTETVGFLHKQVVEKTQRGATSFLRGSIHSEVRGQTLESLRGVVGTPAKYADVVERGRRAGRPMPPSGVGSGLWLWVRRKLRVPEGEARGVAFVIARSIKKEGIEGKHMFRDALRDNRARIQARMRELGFRLARRLGAR